MALTEYEVTVNGTKTVLRLSDEDAKRYPDAKKVGSVEPTRTASEERQAKAGSAETKKADAPANKSADAPQNKTAGS